MFAPFLFFPSPSFHLFYIHFKNQSSFFSFLSTCPQTVQFIHFVHVTSSRQCCLIIFSFFSFLVQSSLVHLTVLVSVRDARSVRPSVAWHSQSNIRHKSHDFLQNLLLIFTWILLRNLNVSFHTLSIQTQRRHWTFHIFCPFTKESSMSKIFVSPDS